MEDCGWVVQHLDCSTERYPEYSVALDSVAFVAVAFAAEPAEAGPESVVELAEDDLGSVVGLAEADLGIVVALAEVEPGTVAEAVARLSLVVVLGTAAVD